MKPTPDSRTDKARSQTPFLTSLRGLAVNPGRVLASRTVLARTQFQVAPSRTISVLPARIREIGLALLLGLLLAGVGGCATKSSRQGVQNLWRGNPAPVFTQGKTTQRAILDALGPPSQLINLQDKTIFYYLREEKRSKGLILVLYNQTWEKITYDRAIFFFDKQGVLADFALSHETVPTE